MSENVTPEQWAEHAAYQFAAANRLITSDTNPKKFDDGVRIGKETIADLAATKRKADAYDALGPNPEAAVKGAREAIRDSLLCASPLCETCVIQLRTALAALGGGK